jgi:hypothetical protein
MILASMMDAGSGKTGRILVKILWFNNLTDTVMRIA